MKLFLLIVLTLFVIHINVTCIYAQGDGPRTMLLAPKDLNVITPAYLYRSSNFNFAQDILIEGADISSTVVPVTYIHFFSIDDKFAQIWVTPIWGNVKGNIVQGSNSINVPTTSGIADPYIAVRVGLVGTPALSLEEFKKHKQEFQLYGLFGINIPIGEYDQNRPVNLGTNRWAFRIGAPMVLPFGNNPARPFFLELVPSLMIFTKNNAPYGASDERKQFPLLLLETHLSHNITSQFWGSADLRFQHGGATETDGISDDNTINQIGGGVTLGYSILPPLGIQIGYSGILISDKSKGTMFRVRVTMMF
jgi:hypothetical protein